MAKCDNELSSSGVQKYVIRLSLQVDYEIVLFLLRLWRTKLIRLFDSYYGENNTVALHTRWLKKCAQRQKEKEKKFVHAPQTYYTLRG